MSNFIRIARFLGQALRRLHVSKEELRNYQEKRLRAVVKYAYNSVPFYSKKFRDAGIHPSDINRLEDLAKLPVIRKEELRRTSPQELISVDYKLENLKAQRTSGSTGVPFKFYVNPIEDDWRRAIYLRANISCGQQPFDNWVFITSPLNFIDVHSFQKKLNIYAPRCISVFTDPELQVKLVRENKPDVLDGYSGALLLLAQAVHKGHFDDIRPRLMFGSAELIDVASRNYLEEIFGAPYLDQFGCAEVQRTAWQCPERIGYHMDTDSVITQFVDCEGNEVAAGENGEIVHTSVFNFAMPFIRYCAGDIGRASADKCPCGRVLPLMDIVEGRKDSFVVLPDGRVLSPRAFTVAISMFRNYDNIEQFRIIQNKVDSLDLFLQMKTDNINKELTANTLKSHLRNALNLESSDIKLNVNFVDRLSLNEGGKLMAVISKVNHSH